MPAKKKAPKRRKSLSPFEEEIATLQAQLPRQQDWRSSDEQELARRRLRALETPPAIRNLEPARRIHSRFEVSSLESGGRYLVEIIDLSERLFFSSSPDFANAALGTCKHTESVLIHLQKRFPALFRKAARIGPQHPSLIVRDDELELYGTGFLEIPRKLRLCVERDGRRKAKCPPAKLVATAEACHADGVRISCAVPAWLERHEHEIERHQLRRDYEQRVHSGEYPQHETLMPLFPYQRRACCTSPSPSAPCSRTRWGWAKPSRRSPPAPCCSGSARRQRCLVVCPASLKTEWEEQIAKFTAAPLPGRLRSRRQRVQAYRQPAPSSRIVNYEQIRSDSLDINAALKPDIVILDEAQRIKNWSTKTAQAIKRLRSRYAFVLTGTPIENRIDELYSIVEFLDPSSSGRCSASTASTTSSTTRGKPERLSQPRPAAREGAADPVAPPQSRRRNRAARPHRREPIRRN